jgi:hypothetical protein
VADGLVNCLVNFDVRRLLCGCGNPASSSDFGGPGKGLVSGARSRLLAEINNSDDNLLIWAQMLAHDTLESLSLIRVDIIYILNKGHHNN